MTPSVCLSLSPDIRPALKGPPACLGLQRTCPGQPGSSSRHPARGQTLPDWGKAESWQLADGRASADCSLPGDLFRIAIHVHCPPSLPQPRLTGSLWFVSGPLPCYPLRKEAFYVGPSAPRAEASGQGLAVVQVSLAQPNTPQVWNWAFSSLTHKWLWSPDQERVTLPEVLWNQCKPPV